MTPTRLGVDELVNLWTADRRGGDSVAKPPPAARPRTRPAALAAEQARLRLIGAFRDAVRVAEKVDQAAGAGTVKVRVTTVPSVASYAPDVSPAVRGRSWTGRLSG